MNSFDLDITAIATPAGVASCVGAGALRELVALQEGVVRNDDRLLRNVNGLGRFWAYVKRHLCGAQGQAAGATETPAQAA